MRECTLIVDTVEGERQNRENISDGDENII
jgi:hypothetical protein